VGRECTPHVLKGLTMFQIAYDYDTVWPEDQPLKIEAHFAQEIAISPTVARRKANGFLAGYIAMMVSAGQPTLILEDALVWRIPAVLRLPTFGEAGILGTVDIDAKSGDLQPLTPEQITRMQGVARALATHFASSPATNFSARV